MKKIYCQDCKKLLGKFALKNKSIRCKSCCKIGNKNPKFNLKRHKKYLCIDCKKTINYGYKRCHKCASTGKNNGNFKNDKTNNNHCLDCGKHISFCGTHCHPCAAKYVFQKIKGMVKIQKPNKMELIVLSLLNKYHPNQFKYVGDYSLWIENCNPDFIDKKRKLIIELFGTYWHKKYRNHKKDLERFKVYKKNNYRCLVIYDKELKKLEEVKNKINNFVAI